MAIRRLVRIGQDSAGVILPMDDLREEDLVDDDQELEELNMRIERVAEGVWMVARTDDVEFDEFNDLQRRLIGVEQ